MNSVLRRRLFKTLHSNHSSPFSTSVSGLISSRLKENPQKDAIRFENQNKTWTYKELEYHSNAFAYGLLELGYKRGDRIVLWVDRSNTSEITVAQIGMAKVGVSFVPLVSSGAQDLQKVLKDSEAKGLVFSGNTKEGGKRRGDVLYEIFPDLQDAHSGTPLSLSSYPKLKNIVTTGFHTLPGTIKYRQLLVYGNPKFQTNNLPDNVDGSVPLIYGQKDGKYKDYTLSDIHDFAHKFRTDNKVEAGDSIVVSGCPYCPGTFASGAYQSLAFGNYVILSGNEDFKTLVGKLQGQQPNYIVLNQAGNEQLNETPAEGSLDRLKGVFVTGKDANQYKSVFGGKPVSSFNAYW